jgi:hypothetical protein
VIAKAWRVRSLEPRLIVVPAARVALLLVEVRLVGRSRTGFAHGEFSHFDPFP